MNIMRRAGRRDGFSSKNKAFTYVILFTSLVKDRSLKLPTDSLTTKTIFFEQETEQQSNINYNW